MRKTFFKHSFGWGFILWLVGYLLGILFVMARIPTSIVGWFIMPIGVPLTIWVIIKKIHHSDMQYYFNIAVIWTLIAIFGDYFFLVRLFKPEDGYYKLDVYIYYSLTFLLPLTVYWWRNRKK